MGDRLSALRLFVRVAHTGSFSRAARDLRLSQPSASRIVATLEKEVGAALFTRSTRALALTEAGAQYLARVEPALADLDEADHAARGTGELGGRLRVAASSSYSVRVLIPKLRAFLDRHPRLRVEILTRDDWQALIREGIDVAFRFGPLPDSTATARRLGATARVLVASPAYLRRAGRPAAPADFATHSLVVGPAISGTETWVFEKDARRASLRPAGRIALSSNEGAVVAAMAGLGITRTSLVACREQIRDRSLVRVLPEWNLGDVELNAVFPAGRAAKASARALAEHMSGYSDT